VERFVGWIPGAVERANADGVVGNCATVLIDEHGDRDLAVLIVLAKDLLRAP
jgi:hypothetical protein